MSTEDTPPIDLAAEPSFPLGPHTVHPSTREIATGHESVTLEPRVMQVLVALAQARGATVSRDRLIARCWQGVVVGDDSIQRCIGRLRKTAEVIGGFEIETLSRVGYRLHAASAVPNQPVVTPTPNAPLLAVLPFDNLSEDAGLSYLADGVAEDILQTIARTSTVTAIGRTSSFQFRGAAKVVAQIGEVLGATHILDGSVRRAGPRVRVSAHLMEVGDQTMLWSDRFEGLVEDLFALQDQVATAVVGVLRGTFHSSRPARTIDIEASDVAMRIRDLINTPTFLRDHGGRELAARLEASIAPQNAETWGLIATAQAALRWTCDEEDEPRLRGQARTAADRALALDPLCGEAHKALFLLAPPAGHFAESEARLSRVCTMLPTNGEVRWALFQLGLATGRVRDAAAHAEVAYRVDALRPPNVTAYGVALYAMGDTAAALSLLEDAVERWPDDASVLALAAWAATSAGNTTLADRLLRHYRPERYSAAARASTERAFVMAESYRHAGAATTARVMDRLRADVEAGRPRFSLMALAANLGVDLDRLYDAVLLEALRGLGAPDGRVGLLDGLSHLFLPMNARLRQSPRFVDLCRALGLVDYWLATETWPDCVSEVAATYDFVELAAKDAGTSRARRGRARPRSGDLLRTSR
jgi:TolB-like protein/tetratricopeptide (TPR) repeat protein